MLLYMDQKRFKMRQLNVKWTSFCATSPPHPLQTHIWSFHLRGWWTFSADVSLSLFLFLSLFLSSELGGWMAVTFSPVRRNNGRLMLAGTLGSWITVLWENVSLNYWTRPLWNYGTEHHASSVQQYLSQNREEDSMTV